ncbi:hypothetical protein FRB99_002887 [Tulasnella sp. 403]|nr:hypothetical protein FRB99_002887 [Tulasnella sp. 403]
MFYHGTVALYTHGKGAPSPWGLCPAAALKNKISKDANIRDQVSKSVATEDSFSALLGGPDTEDKEAWACYGGIQRETVKSFREIAVKYGFTYGKWLCYAKNDTVDSLWNKISTSIVDGPLAVTTAQLAKVSTTKASDEQSQHVICLYLPNIFDKDEAKKVLQILIKEHGITPTGAKPDLYTHINLDSKHKSGIRSTVWQPRELLSDAEIKALRDAYHAQPKNPKAAAAQPKPEATSEVKPGAHPKIPWARSMTKSTAYDSDENKNPFSDDEVDTGAAHAEAERRAALAKKLASSPSKRQLFAPAPRKRKANLQDDHVAGRPKKARASSEDATESEEEVVVRGR